MSWHFEIQTPLSFDLDLSELSLSSSTSLEELLRFPIYQGREVLALGELARITPSPDGIERWSGNLQRVHGLGAGNRDRHLVIETTAGNRVGAGMSGGSIRLLAHGGDDLGVGLAGGTIIVHGSCGARAGGASPGANLGMRGGEILIGGNAGPQAGQRMRRGLLAIAGKAAGDCGVGLIAGTLIVRQFTEAFGLGLKRGSIIAGTRPQIPAWFGPPVAVEVSITRLLSRFLARRELGDKFLFLDQSHWYRAQGDRLERNQGELLFPAL